MKAKIAQFVLQGSVLIMDDKGRVKEVKNGQAAIMECEFDKTLQQVADDMVEAALKEEKTPPAPPTPPAPKPLAAPPKKGSTMPWDEKDAG